ncbi:uncharacterized protein HMPREF1541_09360 [Cyphellophora europaea CBS 101466]|uniref:Uncharacterized protein n=1 Tax=Cyphellophora europaea (strain CBS 101466) TaxID=1220924 RepID=W2SBY5_CYPE1|nr:uncharacterized protein HMPREF1541_09360 [Cyphellophora europaea CBS 101466]ETN45528.1 hypothetical protein HMPREF1541_09360 [Cyphellophora europaea CBS 101466]
MLLTHFRRATILPGRLSRLHQSRRTVRTLPSFSLEGKVAVVTGAGRGLGHEFLTGFALSGARGACIDLTQQTSDASIATIRDKVKQAQPDLPVPTLQGYACDATIESNVKATVDQILADFGQIDVLVTAAGMVDNVEAENYDYARWRRMLDINLDGTFMTAREVGKHMIARGVRGCSIILVASMTATACPKPQKQAAYNASKGAVVMLAKSLATEWAPHGIRVNSLSPGYTRTPLIRGLLESDGRRDLVDSWNADIPIGRIAEPHEMMGPAVWMASDASSYLTGSDVVSFFFFFFCSSSNAIESRLAD